MTTDDKTSCDGHASADDAVRGIVTGGLADGAEDVSQDAGDARGSCLGAARRRLTAPTVLAILSLVLICGSAGYFAFNTEGSPAHHEGASHSMGSAATDDGTPDGTDSAPGPDPSAPQAVGREGGSDIASEGDASPGRRGASADTVETGADGGGTGGAEGNASPVEPNSVPAQISVLVAVDSSAADGSVSSNGTYLLTEGATAFDALRALGLPVGSQQSAYGAYVTSIGGLAEKQFGASSGWMYEVNGSRPPVSSSSYTLKDGDSVRWVYVAG